MIDDGIEKINPVTPGMDVTISKGNKIKYVKTTI